MMSGDKISTASNLKKQKQLKITELLQPPSATNMETEMVEDLHDWPSEVEMIGSFFGSFPSTSDKEENAAQDDDTVSVKDDPPTLHLKHFDMKITINGDTKDYYL